MSVFKEVQAPALKVHKPTGSAYVLIDGKRQYLGKADAPDCEMKYRRFLAEWAASGHHVPTDKPLTVVELCERYAVHAAEYYRAPDGTEAKSMVRVKLAIKDLRTMYGDIPADEFRALKLRALRESWIDKNMARSTINDRATVVKQIFTWGTSHELVHTDVTQSLASVTPLKRGRSRAKEVRKVLPVDDKVMKETLKHLPAPLVALVNLQLLTGARPGELLNLRPCDIDRSGDIWIVTLEHHKNAHRGHERVLYIGPQGQSILRPLLLRDADAPLFSPKDAEADRHMKMRKSEDGGRRPDQKPNRKKSERVVRDAYDKRSYHRAIARACVKAEVSHWHPNQLRHNCGTNIRKSMGLEAAQVLLGHANADVTQIYAERNDATGREIASKHG